MRIPENLDTRSVCGLDNSLFNQSSPVALAAWLQQSLGKADVIFGIATGSTTNAHRFSMSTCFGVIPLDWSATPETLENLLGDCGVGRGAARKEQPAGCRKVIRRVQRLRAEARTDEAELLCSGY